MKVATKYVFELNNYKWGKNFIEHSLGYERHFDSWIKRDERGRYHITYEGEYTFNIHYDVDTVDGKHMTLPSVETLQTEWKRITPAIKYFNLKYKKPVVKTPKEKKIKKPADPPKPKKIKHKAEYLPYQEMQAKLKELNNDESPRIQLRKLLNKIKLIWR